MDNKISIDAENTIFKYLITMLNCIVWHKIWPEIVPIDRINPNLMILDLQVPITSQNFDIRLMMFLMKNLIEACDIIPDVLPFETDITEVADLSRVKHIRNKIVQNSDRSISDEDFEEDWSNLSQVN